MHVRERLRIGGGCDRTTCGNRQSCSGRRFGSQPTNRTTPGICEARELLGERENHTRRSHNDYRKTHILRACTTGISSPEESGEAREEHQKEGLTVDSVRSWIARILAVAEDLAKNDGYGRNTEYGESCVLRGTAMPKVPHAPAPRVPTCDASAL